MEALQIILAGAALSLALATGPVGSAWAQEADAEPAAAPAAPAAPIDFGARTA
ncbi:MAG: hypothetical protein MO852_08795 [Candidatus Devosia euplotis]|nr:hypothetical protein [Candidatus Devosia euplotis]